MKLLLSNLHDFSYAFGSLREAGHELVFLDDEIMLPEVPAVFEREKPDLFLWDPGAPIYERFGVVDRLMQLVGRPRSVFFTVMPNEWSDYCDKRYPNIQVVKATYRESYEDVLTAAMAS